ncbi:MAG: class I SAM-dependent methyltransferase [Candidatus Brocadiales bacterium]|nr:class I SAM-dependent methyltransferase [Candidatus Brocadiales bacterium]
MYRLLVKKVFKTLGIDSKIFNEKVSEWSIKRALSGNGLFDLVKELRTIVPDISDQESSERDSFNDFWEFKRRALQSFQCNLMLKAIKYFTPGRVAVADIGDSAGTHMLYLRKLAGDEYDIDSLSVNLDPRAIKKIESRGLKAVHCRAEDLGLRDKKFDLVVSFQMVEHLHNPSIFFKRLATSSVCNRLVVTVPYVKSSRVGLHYIRLNNRKASVFAEDVHIYELNPEDWSLLMLHSGWRVIYKRIYYQYPRNWPIISKMLGLYWRVVDYEGFWGVILERDTTFSECYQDWED